MPHPQYKAQNLPVYSVAPNWKNAVNLRTIYNTLVREALDNGEERQTRFPRCLYGLRYQTLPLEGQETGYIRRVLELAQALPVIMPVWTEGCRLLAEAGIGDSVLSVDDTDPTLFSVLTDYVIIWSDFKTWEVLAVDEISGDEITLSDVTTRVWPAGTVIFPILIGYLERNEQRQLTDQHGVHAVSFEERFNGLTYQGTIETVLPDLEWEFTSECQNSFSINFVQPPGLSYMVQIADNLDGPWGDHIAARNDGLNELLLNNDYNGEYFFRLVDQDGEIVRGPVNPEASTIPAPTIEISNVVESDRSLHADEGFVLPYSNVENAWMTVDDIYIVPRGRFERSTVRSGTPVGGEIVSISGAVGAVHKWTRNALNPTIDTVMPPLNGLANNLAVSKTDFGFVIKACSFKDGCQSPYTMLLVDRRITDLNVWFRSFGLSALTTGGCDLPSPSTGSESGASCNVNFGGTAQFEDAMAALAQANASMGHHPTLLKENVITTGLRNAWYGDFQIHTVAASYFYHDHSEIYRLPGFWDGIQDSWLFGEVLLAEGSDGTGPALTVAPQDFNQSGETIAGAGNSNASLETSLSNYIDTVISFPSDGAISLKQLEVVLTLHHDVLDPFDEGYVAPVAEEPEEPVVLDPLLEIWWDRFEEYADTEDAASATLNGETGWDGAWEIVDYEAPSGIEDFETYTVDTYPASEDTDELFDVLLDDGDGFTGHWFFEAYAQLILYEDFEEYAVDEIDVFVELNGSTGWDGAWFIQGNGANYSGSEDFESYAVATLAEGDSGVGEDGDDFDGNWFIASTDPNGYIYYRINIASSVVPNGSWIGMHEFQLFTGASNLALGATASASAVFSGGTHNANKANDGDVSGTTGWSNNGVAVGGGFLGWLQMEMPTSRIIDSYGVGHYPDAGAREPTAKNWTLQASKDGTNWTTLDSVSNNTGHTLGQIKLFSITDTRRLLMGFEGVDGSTTMTDESPAARTVTPSGNAQIDTAQFKFGASSLLLDGTGDFLTAAHHADFAVATPFTMECFLRLNASPAVSDRFGVIAKAASTFANGALLGIRRETDTGQAIRVQGTAGFNPGGGSIVGTTTLALNTWYHAALSYDGTNLRLFLDGVLQGTLASTIVENTLDNLLIGRWPGSTVRDFNGWIDEVRFTSECLYIAAFTAPTAAFPR